MCVCVSVCDMCGVCVWLCGYSKHMLLSGRMNMIILACGVNAKFSN